jgi:putative ABC transport system permease protein
MRELLLLLYSDFVRLVLFGLLMAAPISWYLLDEWLSGFAYRIDFAWWSIALAGFVCLTLTLLTVGYQSLKATKANPALSLRAE